MDDIEFYEEPVSGGILRLPATRWRNDTASTCIMTLFIDSARPNPHWRPNMPTTVTDNPCMLPAKWKRVVLRPGEGTLLPAYLDRGVQELACQHPACAQRPLACTDPEHEKGIIGGLGPNLTRVSPRIAPTTPTLAPALGPTPPTTAPTTIDDRLMERARRGVVT